METLTSHNKSVVFDNIMFGTILTSMGGEIVFWDQSNENIFGYKSDEILEESIDLLYDHTKSISFRELLKECAKQGEIEGQWLGVHKSGARIWLDVRAKLLHGEFSSTDVCIISLLNVSKLKKTERQLRRSKLLAQNLFDNSADAIIIINDQGNIFSCNVAVKKMFGYQEMELAGKSVNEILPHVSYEDGGFMKKNIFSSEKINGVDLELQGVKKDGTEFPVEMTLSEINWDNRKIFTGIIRDLTERRNLERRIFEIGSEERRRIGYELHDGLGQMLTGIRFLSENLAKKLKAQGSPGVDAANEIAEMVKDADEYTRSLSRGLVHVDMEKKGLSVGLQKLCSKFTSVTGVSCQFVESGDVEIENYNISLHLFRIAQEAVNNAIKHANADHIVVHLSRDFKEVCVTVTDNGDGFEMGDGHGNGLGIQIMRHRAGMLGGFMEIERTENEETQVRCVVPNEV